MGRFFRLRPWLPKKKKKTFSNDALKRVTIVKRYTWNGPSHVHQACQDVDYVHGTLSGGGQPGLNPTHPTAP